MHIQTNCVPKIKLKIHKQAKLRKKRGAKKKKTKKKLSWFIIHNKPSRPKK
jgi:hypothetical protein